VKTCGRCKRDQPLSAFSRRGSGHQPWCKSCSSEHKHDWIAENRDKVRWNQLWTRFRLRREDWERLWQQQGGLCAVCRLVEPTHVDHDHACCPGIRSCGKCVRGLLCSRCNMIVGVVEGAVDLFQRATDYLAPSSMG
jgi:hypothetical protein